MKGRRSGGVEGRRGAAERAGGRDDGGGKTQALMSSGWKWDTAAAAHPGRGSESHTSERPNKGRVGRGGGRVRRSGKGKM